VAVVGADNMSWDVPEERDQETGSKLFGHVCLLPQKGIYIMENLNLEELARDGRYVFAFIGIPLKFNGATGSPLRSRHSYEAVGFRDAAARSHTSLKR
jgi:kynurenine formamidase